MVEIDRNRSKMARNGKKVPRKIRTFGESVKMRWPEWRRVFLKSVA
jgi:hypothetical protein